MERLWQNLLLLDQKSNSYLMDDGNNDKKAGGTKNM